MTDFLKLNGIRVDVALNTGDLDHDELGESHRTEDGTPLVNRRAVKRKWNFRLTPQLAATALAFRNLVFGFGHNWSFESQTFFSAKGLAPTYVGANMSFVTGGHGAKFGTYFARGVTSDNYVNWLAFKANTAATAAVWYYDSTWKHLLLRTDGAKWFNGVRNDAGASPFLVLTPSTGQLTLGEDGVDGDFDDLVLLPWLVPDDWPAQMYAFNTAFPDLPFLKASGDEIEDGSTVDVLGKGGRLQAMVANRGTGKKKAIQNFAFMLEEK